MRTCRRRVALAGGIALAALLAPARPALAAAPTVSISSPGAGQQLDSAAVTVAARAQMSNGIVVDTIRFRLQQLDSERPDITASRPANESSSQDVTFPVDLPYNGRYRATVTATGRDRPLDLNGDESSSATREFFVAAPPASPTGVKVAVDTTARTVALTWKANSEPDMLFYLVQRAKGPSGEFTVLGKVTEPTFSDASTAEAGGEYRYQVIAVRKGIEEGKGLNSDPSELTADSTAAVPDPPPPPTTAPAPGTTIAAAAGGATATTAAPKSTVPANSPGALTTSGTVDLKGFTSVQSQAVRRAPRVVEPDTGFESTLPFAPRPDSGEGEEAEDGGELGEVAADSPQFRELGDGSDANDRQRTMAFLAAGLLSTVLLMHVLWVKSEVKRVPLEALIPEGPLPAARIDDVRTGKVKPVRGRRARAKGPASVPEWFIPERLGMDEAGPEREKVVTGS